MRVSWKALGVIGAVVLAHGMCAGAVSVSTSAELASAITGGQTDITLGAGTYTLTEPIRVTGKLSLKGVLTTTNYLPTKIVFTDAFPLNVCAGNVFKNGAFDSNLSPWVSTSTTSAVNVAGAVRFAVAAGVAAGTKVRLTQAVDVPANPDNLKFTVSVPVGTAPLDKLECQIQSVGSPDLTLQSIKGDAGTASQDISVVIPAAYRGKRCTVVFLATFSSGTAAAFELDNVCLAPVNPALITVAESGQLTLEKLQIAVGTIGSGVLLEKSGTLAMRRCFVTGAAKAGVEFDGTSSGTIISSVFDQNTDGAGVVCNTAGSVVLFQSTFRGNGTNLSGTGASVQLVACLLDSGPTSPLVKQYLNYIIGASGGGEPGFTNLDGATFGMPAFLDSIWRGKLDPLALKIRAALAFGDLPATLKAVLRPLNWTEDFEGLPRYATGPLGVGASEQIGGVPITEWGYSVTPAVAGPGKMATITVWTNAPDLTGMELGLRMIPELPPVGFTGPTSPYIVVPLPDISVDNSVTPPRGTASGTISFDSPFNPAVAEDANGVISTVTACTDGAPSFILTQMKNPVDLSPSSTSPFIIDTVAPKLDLDPTGDPPTIGINKNLVTLNATEGPAGWQPLLMGLTIPKSQGSLADRDVHWFIRDVADTDKSLLLTVHGHFLERFPSDASGNEYRVTVSGFDPAAIATTLITPKPATGNPVDFTVDWTYPISDYRHTYYTPDAQDRGGNVAVVYSSTIGGFKRLDHQMHAWYMAPGPTASFSLGTDSTPQGQQTLTPHFGWTVTSYPDPPSGEEYSPCAPMVGFKIWALDPTSNVRVAQCNWIWVLDKTIQKSTVDPVTGQTLNDIISIGRGAASQARQMFIDVRGGDEAGNVQPDDATVQHSTWIDGAGQENVAVDTDLNVQLSHVYPNANPARDSRSFGSVARVPLPSFEESQKQGAYVRATVSMSARFPAAETGVSIHWKLYEDGALVAQGDAPVDSSTGQTPVMQLPEALTGSARDFLRLGPDGVKNRMGDEGSKAGVNRQREVHYMLVAQTEATVPTGEVAPLGNPILQSITDPTPASVEFSIYVPEMENKVREEQPVRIYERQ